MSTFIRGVLIFAYSKKIASARIYVHRENTYTKPLLNFTSEKRSSYEEIGNKWPFNKGQSHFWFSLDWPLFTCLTLICNDENKNCAAFRNCFILRELMFEQ